MKKSFLVLLLISIAVIYFGCNKDNPVSTNNNNGGTTTRTYTFGKTNSNVPVNLGLNQDTIRVDTSGTINSVIFNLDTILNITATQLEIFLEHSGIRDTLVYQLTNPGTNFIGTIFSDAATASINTGSGNYSGTFKPYKPLSVFNGLSVNGQWKLIINSYVAQRSGVIKSWSVTINYNPIVISNSIWPLAVGNYWIYRDSTTGGVILDTSSIVGTSIVHGKQVYSWKTYGNAYLFYFRNESDGLWSYGTSWDTISPGRLPHLIFKYPVNQNETYITTLDSGKTDTMKCININATFYGYTGCIEYHKIPSDTNSNTTFMYLKPGIGFVGEIGMQHGSFNWLSWLTQYHLNK